MIISHFVTIFGLSLITKYYNMKELTIYQKQTINRLKHLKKPTLAKNYQKDLFTLQAIEDVHGKKEFNQHTPRIQKKLQDIAFRQEMVNRIIYQNFLAK